MSRLATAAAPLVVVIALVGAFALRGEPSAGVDPPAGAPAVSLKPSCPTTTVAEPYALDIAGFAYCPAKLTVPAGAEIGWTNLDLAPHTVTYDGAGVRADSGSMAQGQRWTTRFDVPGTYEYYCRFHPGMTGSIVVEVRA
jgi:plastocyanin